MEKRGTDLAGPRSRHPRYRWIGLCGITVPILMCVFLLMAIFQAPWWSITNNSLSSLAGTIGDRPYWSATGAPAVIMNFGLILCGTLMIVFSSGLWGSDVFHNGIGKLGKTLYISASVMLFGIGVFPLTVGPVHYVVSYSFFTLAPISMLLMGISAIQSGKGIDHKMGYVFVIMAVSGAIPFVIMWPWSGLAIPEILAIIPQVRFSAVVGYELMVG